MSNDAKLVLLEKRDAEALLVHDDVLDAVSQAFELHSRREGRVFPVVRERLATGAVFGIKSGDVPGRSLLGVKAAGFWPSNREVGGESHQATILLIDPATGRPLCLIDGNAVTAMRTGAAGALGLKLLARSDSATLCVFGTGVQAAVQTSYALRVMPELRQIHYVTSSGKPAPAFESRFRDQINVAHATDANAAVSVSDVVVTATPGRGALFDVDSVQPGTHLNCVGTDTRGKRELPEGLLARVRLFVDDREQARQIGESQWGSDTLCVELGDLLTGKAEMNRDPSDITLFDLTGLALQDLAVARLLHERAMKGALGTSIAWPW